MRPTKSELISAAVVMLAIPIVAELALRIGHVQFEPQFYTADQQRGCDISVLLVQATKLTAIRWRLAEVLREPR
jgi:hypothetical protein